MKRINQRGFHIIEVLIIIVVIAAIGFVGMRVVSKHKDKDGGKFGPVSESKQDGNQSGGGGSFLSQYANVCKDRSVNFTNTPIALDKMRYLDPLGKVSDGHVTPTDHVYVAPLSVSAADNTTDVVMPAAGTVVQIDAMPAEYIGDKNQQTAPEDHRLVVSFSCQYFSIFIHVHQLAPALKALVGDQQPNTQKMVSVDLKAGDLLGKVGGNPVDWTMIDTTKKLSGFITPSLYSGESWKINTIDPTSLYKGSLKAQFEAKSLRSTAPIGGKIDYDQKGKLVGNWFRSGTGGYSSNNKDQGGRYYDGHLSIAPDYIDPTSTIYSVGNWQGKAKQMAIKGSFDATSISASSGPTKFELIEPSYSLANGQPWVATGPGAKGILQAKTGPVVGTVLVEVQSGEKLKVEQFPGKTAAQVTSFTSAAQTYER